jgi:hypothetical protein
MAALQKEEAAAASAPQSSWETSESHKSLAQQAQDAVTRTENQRRSGNEFPVVPSNSNQAPPAAAPPPQSDGGGGGGGNYHSQLSAAQDQLNMLKLQKQLGALQRAKAAKATSHHGTTAQQKLAQMEAQLAALNQAKGAGNPTPAPTTQLQKLMATLHTLQGKQAAAAAPAPAPAPAAAPAPAPAAAPASKQTKMQAMLAHLKALEAEGGGRR